MKLSELMSVTACNTHILIDDYVGSKHWNIHTETPFKVFELIERGILEDMEIATVEIRNNIHEGVFHPSELVVYLEIVYDPDVKLNADVEHLYYSGDVHEPR